MPTGRIEMSGPSRAIDSEGTIVFADATLTVDTVTRDVSYSAQYEFPDGGPIDSLAVNLDATLDGTSFQDRNGSGRLSGNFYGQDGGVVAGFWDVTDDTEDLLAHGAYIVGFE